MSPLAEALTKVIPHPVPLMTTLNRARDSVTDHAGRKAFVDVSYSLCTTCCGTPPTHKLTMSILIMCQCGECQGTCERNVYFPSPRAFSVFAIIITRDSAIGSAVEAQLKDCGVQETHIHKPLDGASSTDYSDAFKWAHSWATKDNLNADRPMLLLVFYEGPAVAEGRTGHAHGTLAKKLLTVAK